MKYLLDTCVISELSKKRPHPAALRWLQERDDLELYVSSVTVGELRKGIERLPDEDARRQKLEAWFDGFLESFDGRVVPFDQGAAVAWGRIVGWSMRTGRVRSLIDMQIAATAFQAGMMLVTRNVKDMEGAGVRLLNPFD